MNLFPLLKRREEREDSIDSQAPPAKQPPQDQKQSKAPKPITVIFCIPGKSYSSDFFLSWTELLVYCITHGIRPLLSSKYSCNVYYSRNMCLGGNVLLGENQKPFNNGKIKYDFIVWIDPDVIFTVQQFAALLEHVKKHSIVSGVYRMTDGNYAAVENWDIKYFKKNGHFEFLTEKDIQDYQTTGKLVPVSYSGMGFMAVQRGVFESLKYPWFKPIEKRIGNAVDFTMEDVSFCLRAKQEGYKILIDPRIRVLHQKEMLI